MLVEHAQRVLRLRVTLGELLLLFLESRFKVIELVHNQTDRVVEVDDVLNIHLG